MAGDAVLTRDGPVGVPLDYVVPQSGELLPLTVRATIDGSGAAVSFYATVQVLAPSGRIMGSYISSAIAAGGSADVTWFPHVGGGSAAPTPLGSAIVRAYGFEFSGQTVTAGTTTPAQFDTVATSDATKLSWSTTTHPNDTLTTHGNGWLQLVASCYWPAGTKIDLRIHSSGGYELFPHDGFDSMSGYGVFDSANLQANLMDVAWYDITATSNVYRVQLTNSDAGNSGPTQCYVAAMFYPGLQL